MKYIYLILLGSFAFLGCEKEDVEPEEEKPIPKEMRIDAIKITSFPKDDNGKSWDPGSGPDITIQMEKNGVVIYSHSEHIEDADPIHDYTFVPNNLIISDINARHILRLYDYESSANDDYMGGIEFTPFDPSLPKTINLSCNGCVITAEVEYSYIY